MATSLTPKQENFCLKRFEIGNASEAYRLCYDTKKMKPESVNRLAKQLMDNVKIASRLKELSEKAIKRNEITVDDLIKELEEARSAAMVGERPQAAAAIAATMGKAKLLGLGIEKHEVASSVILQLTPQDVGL